MKMFLFAIYLFVAGCGGAAGVPENRLLYYDNVAREMLIDALKARSIAYRVDQEGGVWYPAKDVRVVDEIAEGILKSRFGPAVSYEDPADMDSLKRKLSAAGVRYQTKIQYGRERVTWLKEDEKRVEEILEEVDKESMERSKAKRARQKVPRPSVQPANP